MVKRHVYIGGSVHKIDLGGNLVSVHAAEYAVKTDENKVSSCLPNRSVSPEYIDIIGRTLVEYL